MSPRKLSPADGAPEPLLELPSHVWLWPRPLEPRPVADSLEVPPGALLGTACTAKRLFGEGRPRREWIPCTGEWTGGSGAFRWGLSFTLKSHPRASCSGPVAGGLGAGPLAQAPLEGPPHEVPRKAGTVLRTWEPGWAVKSGHLDEHGGEWPVGTTEKMQ